MKEKIKKEQESKIKLSLLSTTLTLLFIHSQFMTSVVNYHKLYIARL